ncbi:MAG TPA: hypothetical protein VNW95_16180 [Mucilaginibacter sp.]|jgi:hypothetical protein|nr:hypothetical protein [Mucilaginibacter sp.]
MQHQYKAMEDREISLLIETNKAILAKIEMLNKRFEAIENKFETIDDEDLKQAILMPVEQLNEFKAANFIGQTGSY